MASCHRDDTPAIGKNNPRSKGIHRRREFATEVRGTRRDSSVVQSAGENYGQSGKSTRQGRSFSFGHLNDVVTCPSSLIVLSLTGESREQFIPPLACSSNLFSQRLAGKSR